MSRLRSFSPQSFFFSSSFCRPIVASAIKAIDLIEKDPSLPGRVLANAQYFRDEMQGLGFKVRRGNSSILIDRQAFVVFSSFHLDSRRSTSDLSCHVGRCAFSQSIRRRNAQTRDLRHRLQFSRRSERSSSNSCSSFRGTFQSRSSTLHRRFCSSRTPIQSDQIEKKMDLSQLCVFVVVLASFQNKDNLIHRTRNFIWINTPPQTSHMTFKRI